MPALDPVPALRMLCDLPLRAELDAETTAALRALEERVRQPAGGWAEIYADAARLAERIVADCDRKSEAAQRRTLELEEHGDRGRSQGGPRRRLEAVRGEVKQLAGKLRQDWRVRLQKQIDQVGENAAGGLAQPEWDLSIQQEKAELRLKRAWHARFTAHVESLVSEWRAQVAERVSADLTARAAEAVRPLADLELGAPPAPAPPALATDPVKLSTPVQSFDVPRLGAALWQYVRSNLMAVTMFGTMLFSAAAVLGFGGGGLGSMQARGWLILGLGPFCVIAGILAARRQRRAGIEKGRAAKEQAVIQALTTEVQKQVGRAAADLERASGSWLDTAVNDFDTWVARAAEPGIARAETTQQEDVRALRLESRQLQEKLGELRGLRSQLAQNMLPELRRRLRDLGEAPRKAE